ncbi:Early B-cell factor [Fasciola gigantica]|uniref:Early B-cell factor n=1 Tax=Fasciola gigantica TaxID=46835 RepID=A0A504YRF6_FASGI|nr:Early B-cell factor [Fasciola gigantica]
MTQSNLTTAGLETSQSHLLDSRQSYLFAHLGSCPGRDMNELHTPLVPSSFPLIQNHYSMAPYFPTRQTGTGNNQHASNYLLQNNNNLSGFSSSRDTEMRRDDSDVLSITDPLNPANQFGLVRSWIAQQQQQQQHQQQQQQQLQQQNLQSSECPSSSSSVGAPLPTDDHFTNLCTQISSAGFHMGQPMHGFGQVHNGFNPGCATPSNLGSASHGTGATGRAGLNVATAYSAAAAAHQLSQLGAMGNPVNCLFDNAAVAMAATQPVPGFGRTNGANLFNASQTISTQR